MNDNEIIKTMECCSKLPQRCEECPLMIPGGCGRINKYELALDLINRQKAELDLAKKALIALAEQRTDASVMVRCKDCKHNVANMQHDVNDATDYTDIVCAYFMTDGMEANDFCSRGERSVEE